MASWDLFRELESISREMDNVLRGVGFGRVAEPSFAAVAGRGRYPKVNLREEADAVYVEALLPGIDASALEMTVMGNTLTLAGERGTVTEDATWHRRERGVGHFLRTIDLPADIDAEQVTADYRDGVLNVKLSKAASAKPKRIAIQAR
jgi:HSP20 family protein